MPAVPHVPKESDDEDSAPDLGDVIDRILGGGEDPSPVQRV